MTTVAWEGAVAGTVSWTYDDELRVTSENGISYSYDDDGLLIGAGAMTLTRDPANGLMTGTTLGVVSDSYSYNTFGEVTRYVASISGSPVLSFDYTRDDAGRITSISEMLLGVTGTETYAYDEAGRLRETNRNGMITSYTYDANGNRLTKTSGAVTETATYDDQDRLLTYGDALYTYTANGELESKVTPEGLTSYDHDALGNLRQVTVPDGWSIDYVIDGQNRRVGVAFKGEVYQSFLYGDQIRVVGDENGAQYGWATKTNVPDFAIQQGQTFRIISDHLGSPRMIVQATTGEIYATIGYDAFGNVLSESGNTVVPFRFAGGLYDPDTGLTRFGARDYDGL